MPRATASTAKGTSASKKTTTSKPRARAAHSTDPGSPPPRAPEVDALAPLQGRMAALEDRIVSGFTALTEEVRALKVTPVATEASAETGPESSLPLVADLLRKNLMEHLTPVLAALKRLEERIGFVANRLKHGGGGGGGGPDRPKSWRHDQGRHQRPPRGQQNGQRPTPPQPQQWNPPSAASVQGHFAPRPLPGGGAPEEED